MGHEWTMHRVRAWGKHGIYFGYSDAHAVRTGSGGSALQRCDGCSATVLIDSEECFCGGRPAVQELRGALPAEACCIVVVESDITTYRFPHRHQEREKRGQLSPHFLDADEFLRGRFPSLRGFLGPADILVFRLAPIVPAEGLTAAAFLAGLDRLCGALPRDVRYAVDLNSPQYLLPDYFACLHEHRVAHVLRDLGPGRSLLDQALLPWVFPAEYALLHYDAGFPMWSGDCVPGIMEAVSRCLDEKVFLYGHVRGRDGEGAEPLFSALMEMLDPLLATLSPIRRKAA